MALPNNIPIPFPINFIEIPKTNYKVGRSRTPDVIVIHITDGSKKSCINWFKNPIAQVSAHFLICQDGSIVQFVSTGNTAYGNGRVANPIAQIVKQRLPKNPNDYTISIENEGVGTQDITAAQYATLAKLVSYLGKKWSIPIDAQHVIRHRDIYCYKTCPGKVNVEKIIKDATLIA